MLTPGKTPTSEEKVSAAAPTFRREIALSKAGALVLISSCFDTVGFLYGLLPHDGEPSKLSVAVITAATITYFTIDYIPNVIWSAPGLKELIDKHKLPTPDTWEELSPTKKKVVSGLWWSVCPGGAFNDALYAAYLIGYMSNRTPYYYLPGIMLGSISGLNTMSGEGSNTFKTFSKVFSGQPSKHKTVSRIFAYPFGALTLGPEFLGSYLPAASVVADIFQPVADVHWVAKIIPYAKWGGVFYVGWTNGVGDFCYTTSTQLTQAIDDFIDQIAVGITDKFTAIPSFAISSLVSTGVAWILSDGLVDMMNEADNLLPFSVSKEVANANAWIYFARVSILGTYYFYQPTKRLLDGVVDKAYELSRAAYYRLWPATPVEDVTESKSAEPTQSPTKSTATPSNYGTMRVTESPANKNAHANAAAAPTPATPLLQKSSPSTSSSWFSWFKCCRTRPPAPTGVASAPAPGGP